MTFSTLLTLIGGVVAAGCAIVGVVASMRSRRESAERAERERDRQHQLQMAEMKDRRERRNIVHTQTCSQPQYIQQPVNGEVHHYYHNDNNTIMNTANALATMNQYQMYRPQQNPFIQSQPQYMNNSYYAYGNRYEDPVYPGEVAIGNRSRIEMINNWNNNNYSSYPNQYQYGYYQPRYAYAY